MRLKLVMLLALALAGCDRQKAPAGQAEPGAAEEQIGRIDISHRGADMPAIPFTGPDGAPATLTAFRGKPLLVNLWATWCPPCVREMPTLDKLAVRDADRYTLLVVSMDLAGKREVDPYFAKNRFQALKPYLDKQNVLMQALETETLPTTVMYDAAGKEQWRVYGAMNWDGQRAKTLIEGVLSPIEG